MTRAEIVAEAARRLGDQSPEFVAQVNQAFDYVLRDLAAHECLDDVRQVCTTGELVSGQRDYTIESLTGVTAPPYPDRVVSIRCWQLGTQALLDGPVPDEVFEASRAMDTDLFEGAPRVWRYFPNRRTIQFHPIPGDDQDGLQLEVLYIAAPESLGDSDDLSQVRLEDVETVVFGLKARLASFLDDTLSDAQTDWQLYMAGRDRMWARLHNQAVGQVLPADV